MPDRIVVGEIYDLERDGTPNAVIAHRAHISESTVSRVLRRKREFDAGREDQEIARLTSTPESTIAREREWYEAWLAAQTLGVRPKPDRGTGERSPHLKGLAQLGRELGSRIELPAPADMVRDGKWLGAWSGGFDGLPSIVPLQHPRFSAFMEHVNTSSMEALLSSTKLALRDFAGAVAAFQERVRAEICPPTPTPGAGEMACLSLVTHALQPSHDRGGPVVPVLEDPSSPGDTYTARFEGFTAEFDDETVAQVFVTNLVGTALLCDSWEETGAVREAESKAALFVDRLQSTLQLDELLTPALIASTCWMCRATVGPQH